MSEITYMSADSHVVERGDLWVTRLDKKYREDAPRIIRNPEQSGPPWLFVGKGLVPRPIAETFSAGLEGEELKNAVMTRGQDDARPGAWDPVERIKEQDIDGVVAEVIYPSLAMLQFGLSDPELQYACFDVYHQWAGEFCGYNPKRFLGIAPIALWDIPRAVKDLERAAKLGFKGGMIWSLPPLNKPYSSPEYDPFWKAAADLKMPLTLHVATHAAGSGANYTGRGGDRPQRWLLLFHDIQQTLTDLIFGGVLERFPGLKVVLVEGDVLWLRHYVFRADRAHEHYGAQGDKQLAKYPSEYMRKQVFATFERDPMHPDENRDFGEYNFMWASDYPHGVSTWPNSLAVIKKNFAGYPVEMRQRIVYDNAAELYNLKS